jgi:DNA-binding protein HU-beta
MNKSELVDRVASGAGVSRGDAEGVLNTFFETVRSSTKSGDTVGWPGFGKFSTASRAARMGRNPQTGDAVKIKASKAMRFSSSSVLKGFLNTKGSPKKAAAKATASSSRGAAAKSGSAGRGAAEKATPARSTAGKASATKASATKSSAAKATATKASGTTKKASGRTAAAKKAPAKKASAGRTR